MPDDGPRRGGCWREIEVVVLYDSGKVWLGWMPLGRVERMPSWPNVVHFEVLPEEAAWRRPIARIDACLRRARFGRGLPVRSCLLCTHQGFTREEAWDEPPVFCLKMGCPVPQTMAVGCTEFEPMPSDEALRRRRERLGGGWE